MSKKLEMFLISDKTNNNNWSVSWEAIKKHEKDFIGKDVVYYEVCDKLKCRGEHMDGEGDLQQKKEDYKAHKVGEIVGVRFDETTNTAYAETEINDDKVISMIESGKITGTSPELKPKKEKTIINVDDISDNGQPRIHSEGWDFVVLNLVSDPAYGGNADGFSELKANEIKFTPCDVLTKTLEASVKPRYSNTNNLRIELMERDVSKRIESLFRENYNKVDEEKVKRELSLIIQKTYGQGVNVTENKTKTEYVYNRKDDDTKNNSLLYAVPFFLGSILAIKEGRSGLKNSVKGLSSLLVNRSYYGGLVNSANNINNIKDRSRKLTVNKINVDELPEQVLTNSELLFQWVCDPEACDRCLKFDGRIMPSNELYIPVVSTHPNCRCQLTELYR